MISDRRLVHIPSSSARNPLEGELTLARDAQGIVVFVHGTGSSRHSPRNLFVARQLQEASPPLATLLVDLLTVEESVRDKSEALFRFDIALLARRLVDITDWVTSSPLTSNLAVGYYGASTGAGAAMIAAAERRYVQAIVSRGGRPDLAGGAIIRVQAPTLLIVGGDDALVLEKNEIARRRMRTECRLEIIPGAGHLFEEPGTLRMVARQATYWFHHHLVSTGLAAHG